MKREGMKTKRLIILGVLALVVVASAISVVPKLYRRAVWKQTVTALQNLSLHRLEEAVVAFERDRKDSPLIPSVPLRDLVSGGYLKREDIRGLENKAATVFLQMDGMPIQVLMEVHLDSGQIVLRKDGSIQALPKR
jgi:hypothetical protein